jgi:hypothetical protein
MSTDERRAQFSAKYDAIHAIGLPTSAPIERLRDVLICPITDGDEVSHEEFMEHPPIGAPADLFGDEAAKAVDLGRGLVIDHLSQDDAELVMNACTPRGHYFAPVRQFSQRFCFVRDVDPEEWKSRHSFQWDPEGVVSDALTMSRLIRDNGYSMQFAARLADFADGEQTVVYTLGGNKSAYRMRRDRDWLDPAEGAELRSLLAALWARANTRPGTRVGRAMFRTEYASWMAWADIALPVIVGGLESLLKTEPHPSTRQFTTRVPAMAGELGFEGITPEYCLRLYDARSEWVHGTHVRLFATGQEAQEAAEEEGPDDEAQWRAVADIARLQDVLRGAVRRCIEDEDFGAVFADDDRIRERWPL